MNLIYEVKFRLPSSQGGGGERAVQAHLSECGSCESENMSRAIVLASGVLADEGIDHWALVTIRKVTS